MRLALACAAGTIVLALAAPARAHDTQDAPLPPQPRHGMAYAHPPHDQGGHLRDEHERARADWLAECRRRQQADRGRGGAAIGAVVGGIAGNRLAGRGNRTVGTIAGAAVGAVAGTAIDRAEDQGKARDWCETYLDTYQARYSQPQPWMSYPHHAAGAVTMVPMMLVPLAPGTDHAQNCRETVTYEYVDVPVRTRRTPAPRPAARKPVRIVPDKRIKL